jgi:PTH1 family peptidyl-tRNA hydrolase
MMLIIGLGNPGKEYEISRHNTGFLVLDNILGKVDWRDKGAFLSHKNILGKNQVEYLKPQKFMNNSGQVVAPLIKNKKDLQKLIVIYDDLDLALGTIKISFNKSSGGHNGLESIIKKLKSQEFVRIRVGISPSTPSGKIRKPKGEEKILKYLLGKYKEDELKTLKKLSKKIGEAIEVIVTEGYPKGMSIYNK